MPKLEITLHGHLLVAGGQAAALGVDLATARRFDDHSRQVPYIPATALRGAVRLQLEALLAGNKEPDIGPYPRDVEGEAREGFDTPIARLFGYSGKKGERNGAREGKLRFSDALPKLPDQARQSLGVRPGLEINDFTSTAEEQKLFFREMVETSAEALVFLAELDIDPKVSDNDLKKLRAAVESTDSIGAGKAKGGGFVSIRWIEEGEEQGGDEEADESEEKQPPPPVGIAGDPSTAARARLLLTLTEPAHFGDGGPQGNHHGTRTFIPGSTVRGAMAWALLRHGIKPEDPAFQSLFLGEASFGDALPVIDPEKEPVIHPATARERRGDKEIKDILVTELARQQVNERLDGVYLRADDGDARFDPVAARPDPGLVRRLRTRVSIDRHTGTVAEGKLFTIEQIEPWLVRKKEGQEELPPRRSMFLSMVEGLNRASAELLAQAAGLPILLGAGRNHGMGRAVLHASFEGAKGTADAEQKVLKLTACIDDEAGHLAGRAGLDHPETGTVDGPVVLALMALSDFVASNPEAAHPLAELGEPDLGEIKPVRSFLNPGQVGGYDQLVKDGALKSLDPSVGAGSVYVYQIDGKNLGALLDRLLPRLRRGVGLHIKSGCGRFGLFEPFPKEKKG